MKKELLIVQYQPEWAQDFERIQEALLQVLNPLTIRIEHIGSTSVVNLASKPIIDIDVIYREENSFKQTCKDLTTLGYFHAGDQGIAGREVFKRNPALNKHRVLDTIQHHLYVCHYLNDELQRHLAFRDSLRENENTRREYEQLKLKIAEMAKQDKKKYALLKEDLASDFIASILHQNTRNKDS